jgi:proline iminopeptidase
VTNLPAGAHLPEHQGHRLWWCERGSAEGLPVLIIHGGPGGRTRAASLAWFEGLPVRCIALDQRGCGQSQPAGGLHHNTLDALVADIERLRCHLGIESWAVAGGSWGALVAVAYAASHPQRCRGLFLRSSFLGSDAEVGAFFKPWTRWLGATGLQWLGVTEAADPLQLLQRSTMAPASGTGLSLARLALAWQAFERAQSGPGGLAALPTARFEPPPNPATAAAPGEPASAADALPPDLAVQAHFLIHQCFVSEQLRERWLGCIERELRGRALMLVHGLDDVVCSSAVSQALGQRWPWARSSWVPGGGHAMEAAPMQPALVAATQRWVADLRVG